MGKYILTGVTNYAFRFLDDTDYQYLKSQIGNEITKSKDVSVIDGKQLFTTQDNQDVHVDFIECELMPQCLFSDDELEEKNKLF